MAHAIGKRLYARSPGKSSQIRTCVDSLFAQPSPSRHVNSQAGKLQLADRQDRMAEEKFTSVNLHRHDPLAYKPLEVGPRYELLANIAAFGEADSFQLIQIVLQRYCLACMQTHPEPRAQI